MSRFHAESFVTAVKELRQSVVLHCPRGSEQEAGLIESTLQQRYGDPMARAFNAWRRLRRQNYNSSSSGIDLVTTRE